MRKPIVILEAYLRLIAHDALMSMHDLAALHRNIKNLKVRRTNHSTTSPEIVSQALDVACAFYPKPVLCLQRSAVLVRMFRRRGVAAQLVIGAQTLPFKAHAWVEIDGEIVNDRLASREKFRVLEVC